MKEGDSVRMLYIQRQTLFFVDAALDSSGCVMDTFLPMDKSRGFLCMMVIAGPGVLHRVCGSGKCASGIGIGGTLIFVGLFAALKVFIDTPRHIPPEERIPETGELKPSVNPRYRRQDEFVSMADVPLNSPDYELKKAEIVRLRKEHGFPAEIDILVHPEADRPLRPRI